MSLEKARWRFVHSLNGGRALRLGSHMEVSASQRDVLLVARKWEGDVSFLSPRLALEKSSL